MKWVDQFCEEAKKKGLDCVVTNRVNGWPETIVANGKKCFAKSMSYITSQGLYFQGVDPKKLEEKGDFVLLCGGLNEKLRDIFIIPWENFFELLKKGQPVNTYQPPREYWQYKFKVRKRDGKWQITVQGAMRPEIDVSRWRFDLNGAIEFLKQS